MQVAKEARRELEILSVTLQLEPEMYCHTLERIKMRNFDFEKCKTCRAKIIPAE